MNTVNEVFVNVAPNGVDGNEIDLILIHQATSEELNYTLPIITNNQRYISFNIPTDDLDAGIYLYKIEGIHQGFLKVIEENEGELITPESSNDDNEIIFYNGE
nr:hypothetical protein [uncultured Sphingobacterium sp.]